MIVQHDQSKPNTVISIDPSDRACLKVDNFQFGNIQVQGRSFDLSPYQGGPFRLYLEADGSFSTDFEEDHYWLMAEVVLPERKFESVPTGVVDENGQEMTVIQEVPLDLEGPEIKIVVFPLPE